MKIRIQSNDLRLRLSDDDLEQLSTLKKLSLVLDFPSDKALQCHVSVGKSFDVTLKGSIIEIQITADQFSLIEARNRSGFTYTLPLKGSELNLTMEYDLPRGKSRPT